MLAGLSEHICWEVLKNNVIWSLPYGYVCARPFLALVPLVRLRWVSMHCMNNYVRGLMKFEPHAGWRGTVFKRWQDKRGVIRQTVLSGRLADRPWRTWTGRRIEQRRKAAWCWHGLQTRRVAKEHQYYTRAQEPKTGTVPQVNGFNPHNPHTHKPRLTHFHDPAKALKRAHVQYKMAWLLHLRLRGEGQHSHNKNWNVKVSHADLNASVRICKMRKTNHVSSDLHK